jgi:succinate dehydrogenase / fumarate reductase cytochrome b subunit
MLGSQVGRKMITGITGFGLMLFIVIHLIGNLLLLAPSPDLFNLYAKKLHDLGPLLIIAELGLLSFFGLHAWTGISIFLKRKQAKPVGYAIEASGGKPSKKTLSSMTMAITGGILLVFLVLHIAQFKFGAFDAKEYDPVTIHGKQMEDLYSRVADAFSNKLIVVMYVGVMAMLGMHLRHGFWSAFQSLGAVNPRLTPVIYTLGVFIAIILAIAFMLIPIIMCFKGGAA